MTASCDYPLKRQGTGGFLCLIFRGDSEFISHRIQSCPPCQLWQPFHGFPSGVPTPFSGTRIPNCFTRIYSFGITPQMLTLLRLCQLPTLGFLCLNPVGCGSGPSRRKKAVHEFLGRGCLLLLLVLHFPSKAPGLCLPGGRGLR